MGVGQGQGQDAKKTKQKEPDRLAKHAVDKVINLDIDGKKLRVRKWDLHTSLVCGDDFGEVLKQFIVSITSKTDIKMLLDQDVFSVLRSHEEVIVKILIETLHPEKHQDNFKTREEAEDWIREQGAAEVVVIFGAIAKQNIRPLVKAVGDQAGGVDGILAHIKGRKVSQPRT